MSIDESTIDVMKELAKMQGILKIVELTDEDRAEIERLESEAENSVLMGMCKGLNIGVRESLKKKHVLGCLSDGTMRWPRISLIKMVCGCEIVGEEIVDPTKLEECKSRGDLVVGEIVFYKDMMKLMRGKQNELRIHIMPLEMPERLGPSAVVGSPSPPADIFIKKRMEANMSDPKLGTIIVGFDD